MNADRCSREDELLDALERRFVGAELESHVTSCPPCAELRLVAGALLEDRSDAMIEAPIPTAGAMWLRIRMQQRRQAEAAARSSLLIGQAATLLIAIALVVSLFGTSLVFEARELVAAIRLSTPLLIALATWILFAPIAGYIAIRQK